MKRSFILGLLILVATTSTAKAADASGAAGDLIDQLIKKQAAIGGVVTAESALPTKHEATKAETAKAETVRPEPAKTEAAKIDAAKSEPESLQPVFNNPASIGVAKADAPKSLWGRMMASLAIALVIFGGGIYALKKWPNAAKKLSGRTKMIEILSQQYLGPKKSLAIIRVAGEAVLIGVTDNNITLLKTLSLLDDDIPAETREAQFALNKNEKQKFQTTLGSKFNFTAGAAEPSTAREDEFSMQGLKEIIGERLKSMKEI